MEPPIQVTRHTLCSKLIRFVFRFRMADCAIEGPNEEGHFKGSCKDACRRCILEEEIEKDAGLDMIGATAIEDKLQEGVPKAIKVGPSPPVCCASHCPLAAQSFLDAGISVW